MNPRSKRPPPPEPDYPAFDETLTSGIDDTVRNLHVLADSSSAGVEWQRYQLDAFKQLTEEAHKLRQDIAGLVVKVNMKASKGTFDDFKQAQEKSLEKSIATLWKYGAGPLWGIITLILAKVFH